MIGLLRQTDRRRGISVFIKKHRCGWIYFCRFIVINVNGQKYTANGRASERTNVLGNDRNKPYAVLHRGRDSLNVQRIFRLQNRLSLNLNIIITSCVLIKRERKRIYYVIDRRYSIHSYRGQPASTNYIINSIEIPYFFLTPFCRHKFYFPQ